MWLCFDASCFIVVNIIVIIIICCCCWCCCSFPVRAPQFLEPCIFGIPTQSPISSVRLAHDVLTLAISHTMWWCCHFYPKCNNVCRLCTVHMWCYRFMSHIDSESRSEYMTRQISARERDGAKEKLENDITFWWSPYTFSAFSRRRASMCVACVVVYISHCILFVYGKLVFRVRRYNKIEYEPTEGKKIKIMKTA